MTIRFAFIALLCVACLTPPSWATTDRFLDIEEVKTPSGITAWLVRDPSLPVLSLHFAFAGMGSRHDTADQQGLSRLLAATLDEGAGPYDSLSFQKELDDRSITLRFSATRDDFTGHLKTLTRHREQAVHLLTLALSEPRFEKAAIDRMRASLQSQIRSYQQDPEWQASRLLYDRLFAGHPYALNSGGTLSGLSAIDRDDLRRSYTQKLQRRSLLIAASGDITADDLAALIDNIFGSLPAGNPVAPAAAPAAPAGQSFLFKQNVPQTQINIAWPGIAPDDPDRDAFDVFNYIFGGGGFGSRIMAELREKRGLTYGMYSGPLDLDAASYLILSGSVANGNAGLALTAIDALWADAAQNPATPQELQAARNYLTGSMPLALTSSDRISGLLLSQQLERRDILDLDTYAARINAVSVDDLKRVAKRLSSHAPVTILVGQPDTNMDTAPVVVERLPNVE